MATEKKPWRRWWSVSNYPKTYRYSTNCDLNQQPKSLYFPKLFFFLHKDEIPPDSTSQDIRFVFSLFFSQSKYPLICWLLLDKKWRRPRRRRRRRKLFFTHSQTSVGFFVSSFFSPFGWIAFFWFGWVVNN